MQLVANGTATAQDIGAGYVVVRTIAPPSSGCGTYRLVVKLTGLNAGHAIVVREKQGASWLSNVSALPPGQTGQVVEIEVSLNSTEAGWEVAVTDSSGLSTAAAWSWFLYQTDLVSAAVEVSDPAVVVVPPTDPAQTTAYVVTRNHAGVATAAQTCWFRLVTPPAGAGNSYAGLKFSATSDADGLLQVALMRGAKYVGRRGSGPWMLFTTPAATTYALPILLGQPDA